MGSEIGDETKIDPFVEVKKGAKIGERCKMSSHILSAKAYPSTRKFLWGTA
jgi:UDP-3-O-[3-hydroxymyristoyl] glucosamine N-acyltransferase